MRPTPADAMMQIRPYIYFTTCEQLSLWGDEIVKIGICDSYSDFPHEVIVLVDRNFMGDHIFYEDQLKPGAIFWEFRYDPYEEGWYFTIQQGITNYTMFMGEKFGEQWGMTFMPGFSYERK